MTKEDFFKKTSELRKKQIYDYHLEDFKKSNVIAIESNVNISVLLNLLHQEINKNNGTIKRQIANLRTKSIRENLQINSISQE